MPSPAKERRAAPPGHAEPASRSLPGRLALGGLLAALVATPFLLLMALVLSEWEPLERLDRDVADDLYDLTSRSDAMGALLRFGSIALDPWVFRLAVVAVAVWLWRRGPRRLAAWAVTTAVIGGVLGVLLKLLVERARPSFPEPVYVASGYSFPSGHALNSFLCSGILLLIFLPVLSRRGRVLGFLAAVAAVLLTGYDRIALGVHYVSDVVAGWIVAAAVLAGTSGAFEIWRREHGRRPSQVSEGVEPEAARSIRE